MVGVSQTSSLFVGAENEGKESDFKDCNLNPAEVEGPFEDTFEGNPFVLRAAIPRSFFFKSFITHNF